MAATRVAGKSAKAASTKVQRRTSDVAAKTAGSRKPSTKGGAGVRAKNNGSSKKKPAAARKAAAKQTTRKVAASRKVATGTEKATARTSSTGVKRGSAGGRRTTAAKRSPATGAPKAVSARQASSHRKLELTLTQERLYKRLVKERDDLRVHFETLEAEQRALAEDPSVTGTSDQELGDCVTSRERDTDLRLSVHVLDLSEKVERALARLEAGTYGRCLDCGKKIPAARLQALPHAELCVDCQGKRERFYGA